MFTLHGAAGFMPFPYANGHERKCSTAQSIGKGKSAGLLALYLHLNALVA